MLLDILLMRAAMMALDKPVIAGSWSEINTVRFLHHHFDGLAHCSDWIVCRSLVLHRTGFHLRRFGVQHL